MKFCNLAAIAATMTFVASCSKAVVDTSTPLAAPLFPYQSYIDNMGKDDYFPTIGNDGNGFNAISNHITYPEVPSSMSLSAYADSLLLIYNTALAFNTIAYDIGTAERYLDEADVVNANAAALDSVNLSGISDSVLHQCMRDSGKHAASWLRKGIAPNSQDESHVLDDFYSRFNGILNQLFAGHGTKEKYAPDKVMPDYDELHARALTDTLGLRSELLQRVLSEQDFEKKCIFARELVYNDNRNPCGNEKEVVAVLDQLLRSSCYSPLLGDLWRMWRMMLQINILGTMSNDGAMYNLLYNDMRNRVALQYLEHLNSDPADRLAFMEFIKMAMQYNIVRNYPDVPGNNGIIEYIDLIKSVTDKDKE